MKDSTVFERNRPGASVVEHALRDVRDACFWLTDVTDPPRYPSLRSDLQTDLAVVGGGFVGLWTAIRAKERDPGRRVVLLEAQHVGWAASGRNGGFCDASITHGEENGRSRWPEEYDTLERLGNENLDGIEATVSEHELDADFERTGSLSVALEPHQIGWLSDAAAGGGGRFLDVDQIRAEVNSPTYLAGLEVPDTTALVHPAKLVYALASLAAELGVDIVEQTPVQGLSSERRGGPMALSTAAGTVRADRVALATNVFPALVRRYRPFTVPVYDYALMTEPIADDVLADIGWRDRQGLSDLSNQFHYYRLSRDNRLLFGGYDAVYHTGKRIKATYEQRPETYRLLAEHLLTTFPQLEGTCISHRWAGPIDTCSRFCAFYASAYDGRVAHTAGYTGLGVGASRFGADVVLDLLDGTETERTSLEMVRKKPMPFPPEPIAAVGINLTRWALDRADHNRGDRNLWLRTLDRFGLGFDS